MNPFKYGQIVHGNDFCSRPELMTTLKKHIEARQNIHLEGERRTGKTSAILEAARQMKGVNLLHIDLFQVKSINDIYSRMLDGISSINSSDSFLSNLMRSIAHVKPALSFDQLTGTPSISITASQQLMPDNIAGLLDFIQKKFENKNLIVFFDEFQDITKVDGKDQILAVMRSRIQMHTNLTYIYAGSIRNQMDMIFNDPESPFYKSAVAVVVGNINSLSFGNYITNRFSSDKKTISSQFIKKIFDVTNGIPGDVQEFCHALWDVTDSGTVFKDADFNHTLDEIFGREHAYYESIVDIVTDTQLRCLKGIAEHNGKKVYSKEFLQFTGIRQPATVTQAIKRLRDLKIIYAMNKQYKFASQFFRIWLLRKNKGYSKT